MRPVSVVINWSENEGLDKLSGVTMPYHEAEARFRKVAMSNKEGSGYDKTSVVVRFDNGDTANLRMSLGAADHLGVRHYIESFQTWLASNPDAATLFPKKTIDFYKSVTF